MKKPRPKENAARSVTDVDRQVGKNVRNLRVSHGMTLVDLSKELGISHQQLQKYETGSNRLSAGILVEASRVLGASLAELFDNTPSYGAGPRTKTDPLRARCHQFIDRAPSRQKLVMMAKLLKVIHDGSLE